MKKSELKIGDILVLRNGDLRKLGENRRIETLSGFLVNNLCYYQDDLLYKDSNGHDRLDIVKVYRLYKEKEEILTEKEKEYITNIIKPFSNKIKEIRKDCCYDKYEYLIITYIDESEICSLLFPFFEKGKYYKNMKLKKEYSLGELGIEK